MENVKRLSSFHRHKVQSHFFRLDSENIYSRFCNPMNHENIISYVNNIDFDKNGIFGIFSNNLDIIGLGECIFLDDKNKEAEVAFSVEKNYQGKGLGNKLMKKVVQFGNIHHMKELKIYFLRNNASITHLVKKYNFKAEIKDSIYSEVSGNILLNNSNSISDLFNNQIEELYANLEINTKWYHKKLNKLF